MKVSDWVLIALQLLGSAAFPLTFVGLMLASGQVQPAAPARHPITVIRVIDGDTVEARVDLGLGVSVTDEIRTSDYDARE